MPFRFNDIRNPRVAGPLPGQMQDETSNPDPVDPAVDPSEAPLETPTQTTQESAGFGGGGSGVWGPSTYPNAAPPAGSTQVPYNINTLTSPGGGPAGGSAGAGGGGAATMTGAPPPKPPAFDYLSGVTSANPLGGSNAVNSTQFASPGSAQALAKQLGGSAYGLQLEGPGMGFSQPMQQIRFGNGQEINAGLANDLYSKYGSAPGTYGNYLVNRDVTGNYGPSAYDTKQNASGAAEMAQIEAKRQQDAQQAQQQYGQYQQQLWSQQQAEQQQATQALMANGWTSPDGSTWTNTQTGETQMADPVRLLMREMPGLKAPSMGWEPPTLGQQPIGAQPQNQAQPQPQPQQNYGSYPQQQPQQQPQQYQAQPYPQPQQSASQVGAQTYQGMQSPQAYQNQQTQGSFAQQSQPGYGQYGGQGQQQSPQMQQRQQRYGSYGGSSMGGNTRQPSQGQSQQQPYTAGSSSTGYKSPYGGGYLSMGGPSQSKAGGYMQTGNNKF